MGEATNRVIPEKTLRFVLEKVSLHRNTGLREIRLQFQNNRRVAYRGIYWCFYVELRKLFQEAHLAPLS